MEDALTRLYRAINYATLATATGSSEQKGALYARLARTLTTQGRVNSEADITHLPNFEAFREVLPVLRKGEDGRRSLHPIWDSPSFIAPAIATLAILYDRTLDPDGRSRLSMRVSREPGALYGYRLESLDAAAHQTGPDGSRSPKPMDEVEWMHVSIVLCGAALSFLKEESVMRFAPYYLHAQMTQEEPPEPTLVRAAAPVMVPAS